MLNIASIFKVAWAAIRRNKNSNQATAPEDFSPQAQRLLAKKVAAYAVRLASEARRISKYHLADSVSAIDVKHASQLIASGVERKHFKNIGMFGSSLLGFAGQQLFDAISASEPDNMGKLGIAMILAIIGAFMIALCIALDGH